MRHGVVTGAILCLVVAASAQQPEIDVVVDGQPVVFRGVGPQAINGRVLVPLRGVLERIGAYVDWQPAGRLVTATRGDIDLQLRIGERVARVNGRPVPLDVPAMILRGSTMVPLRFVSEALGAEVIWDARQYAVIINTQTVETGGERTHAVEPVPALRVSSFTVEPQGWLPSGTEVRFALAGTPGGAATVVIPGVTRSDIRLVEIRPGLYTASWIVPEPSPDVLTVSRANAVARLRIDGRERFVQATEALTIDSMSPEIRSMYPEPQSRTANPRPMISAILDDGTGSGLEPNTVRVRLDGLNVTEEATITDTLVSFRPTLDLSDGEHEVQITARDYAGNVSTRSWSFEVDGRGGRVVRSLEVAGAEDAVAGDIVRLTLHAEPGGRATFSIEDVIRDARMEERDPGTYVGTYRVRRGDQFDRDDITTRFVSGAGDVYTVRPSAPFEVRTGALEPPVITSPASGVNVRTPLVIEGRAAPNRRVLVRLEYNTEISGGVRLRGIVSEVIVVADENGRFITPAISLDPLMGPTTFTIVARTLGSNGVSSEPASVSVLG